MQTGNYYKHFVKIPKSLRNIFYYSRSSFLIFTSAQSNSQAASRCTLLADKSLMVTLTAHSDGITNSSVNNLMAGFLIFSRWMSSFGRCCLERTFALFSVRFSSRYNVNNHFDLCTHYTFNARRAVIRNGGRINTLLRHCEFGCAFAVSRQRSKCWAFSIGRERCHDGSLIVRQSREYCTLRENVKNKNVVVSIHWQHFVHFD